jgi:hypothetical protein
MGGVFKPWDLRSKPALVTWGHTMGTLGRFGVHYFRRESQFRAEQLTSLPQEA